MFENILNSVKEQIGGQLKKNTGLNDEQVSQTVQIAGESVQDSVKHEVTGGNMDGLMHLFGSTEGSSSTTNPIVENAEKHFVTQVVSKLGLSNTVADTAKNIIMPYLIKTISNEFSASKQNNAEGLLSMFRGGGKDAIFDTLKGKLDERLGDKLGGLF